MAVTSTSSSNRGSILGGAIGGAVFFAALIALAIFLMRRKRAEEPLFPSLRRVLHLKRSRTYQHITPYSITSIPSSTEFLTTSPPGVLGAEFDGPQMSEVQRSALASGSSTALQPTEQDLRHTPPITNSPLKKLNTAYRPQTHARTRSWQRHSSESLRDIDFPPEYQSCA
ncbi:hypothetical protein BJ138DRAFT_1165683 [Hygrophoropsis aurantiaca]|uniref:Uncharacterized protein n=1 Tax=Hygrophoropsis aurantiaca TaxID=72124 RepID=A0ACB7ZW56_9AGAM|nr:hypothetical protein BJ138DRAFT_1165683 [Hygrophoropsis aurantiaca]